MKKYVLLISIVNLCQAINLCDDGKLKDSFKTEKNLDEYFIFRREFDVERSHMSCYVEKTRSGKNVGVNP